MVAELVELLWRHRFEDIDLLLEQPLDCVDAAELFAHAQQVVPVHREHRAVDFV